MSNQNSLEEYFRRIPAGFRFKPTDEELINYYLRRKLLGLPLPPNKIREVNIYSDDPETLTAMNIDILSDEIEKEWYCFTPRERRYINGSRPARNAGNGYWKATAADKAVLLKGKKIGCKRTLVFYQGKPPSGSKTNWIMHEYVSSDAPARVRHGKEDMKLDNWVLCRLHKNSREEKKKRKTLQEGNGLECQEKVEADRGAIVPYEMAAAVSQPIIVVAPPVYYQYEQLEVQSFDTNLEQDTSWLPRKMAEPVSEPINMVAPPVYDQYEQLEVQSFDTNLEQDTSWLPRKMAEPVSEPINMVAPPVYVQYEQLEVQPFNMNLEQDTNCLPEEDNPMPLSGEYSNYYMFDNDPTLGGGFQQAPNFGDFVTNAAAAPMTSLFPLGNQFQSMGNADFNLSPPPLQFQPQLSEPLPPLPLQFQPHLSEPPPPLQFQPQLSAPPSPLQFQPQLSAPPSPPQFQPQLSAPPSPQQFQPQLSAPPSPLQFQPQLSAPPSPQQFLGVNSDTDSFVVDESLLDSEFGMPPPSEFC